MPGCLTPLLDRGYLAGTVAALCNNALRVRYCSIPFASKISLWNHGDGSDAFRTIHTRLGRN